ncbi:MAG: glycosyltransferase family 9 protein [Chlamydiae bacterium]|jgi:heptosyltransferase I|nr:glycosyltransferase family 9 protein [Chlamydiota bacterium]
MRICIVRLSALGDIVMSLPLIRTLQKNFPSAEITWIVGKPFYPLFEGLQGVNVIGISKIKSFRDWLTLKKKLKKYEFDILLATQASFSAHLIYTLIRAKRKIGYDPVRSKDFHALFVNERIPFIKEHTVEGFLGFAKKIGAIEMVFDGAVPIEDKKKLFIKTPYFVVNPCSSKLEKDWNYKNYIPLISYVKEKFGLTPVVIGVGQDKEICEMIAKESACINLCGKTDLKELVQVLKEAKFLLSPDSGPLHIASGLKTPAIGLFGPTTSSLTGPYFSKEMCIDKHSEVLEKYASEKQRKKGWNVRIYHKDAMNLISMNEVKNKISEILNCS